MAEEQLVFKELLSPIDAKRLKHFKEKGCGFWLGESSKHCGFPNCFCYPFWQKKYKVISTQEWLKRKPRSG